MYCQIHVQANLYANRIRNGNYCLGTGSIKTSVYILLRPTCSIFPLYSPVCPVTNQPCFSSFSVSDQLDISESFFTLQFFSCLPPSASLVQFICTPSPTLLRIPQQNAQFKSICVHFVFHGIFNALETSEIR